MKAVFFEINHDFSRRGIIFNTNLKMTTNDLQNIIRNNSFVFYRQFEKYILKNLKKKIAVVEILGIDEPVPLDYGEIPEIYSIVRQ